MKTEEFTNGNKLIAEFMGVAPKWNTWSKKWVYNDGFFCYISNTDREKLLYQMEEHFKYSVSWDWLMPVVEKIEALGYDVEIGSQHVRIHNGQDDGFNIDSWNSGSKMEAVFAECVEFAKWYKN